MTDGRGCRQGGSPLPAPIGSAESVGFLDLTVIILTYNEALHIARAIRSVSTIARRIVVIDSYSEDETAAIAREHHAEVLEHRFVNQARQFQWAIEHCAIDTAWILRLDADEIVEPQLVAEIASVLPTLPPAVTGINLKRRHLFMGRLVAHGGRYPLLMLRLFRKGAGRVEDRWMDEHIVVDHGHTITLRCPFTDDNLNDLTFFTDKHNRYATREAIDVLLSRRGFRADEDFGRYAASRQAAVKRYIKSRLYNRIPFPVAAFAYFLYRYVLQLGFLDGPTGTIYHVLQGFWYRFLVGAKTLELDRATRDCRDRTALRSAIRQLTGHDIDAGHE